MGKGCSSVQRDGGGGSGLEKWGSQGALRWGCKDRGRGAERIQPQAKASGARLLLPGPLGVELLRPPAGEGLSSHSCPMAPTLPLLLLVLAAASLAQLNWLLQRSGGVLGCGGAMARGGSTMS